ncbi:MULTISPECIES: aminopeptidase N [Pseudoalteromonas]|uniref:Aminopeptidase N n=1 Tax=Pseudoalteromonas amylolytica TaxID=1859457 RepID=A0A1S1MYY3_9GAMM|nr:MULTISPECIES: aminopeptidase N [Pseudoalteromonas]OHU87944.1 aminopeptidase N [Pseudoalteromonas sp. JW3]OHU91384.1 aminopeptidase N [Pseudoalteromonas amylolytica]
MQTKPQAKYLKDYKAPSHQVEQLELTFDLHPTQTMVTAKAKYLALEAHNSLTLDGVDLKLVSLKVDGKAFDDYQSTSTTLTLSSLPNEFELEIVTEISPQTNTALEGLYLSGGAYCTQCEAEGFRKITYFLDRPDVLTVYTVTVIGDRAMPSLLSNGNKVAQGTLEGGRHYTTWHDPFKKPSYLFALVAGDFDELKDEFITRSGRKVELVLFVDKGNLSKAPHAMASLKNAMKWDEERFNLEYDLDIYMIVAVDFFNMGAMENKGLNVFNSACVLANQQTATDRDYHTIESIVGHEYFHNWTGNRVTCRDWFQLSLKEGLTVFRDQEFSSDLGSRGLNRIDAVMAMRMHQFAEDAGPMAHPIRPNKVIEMNNFYTVTVYNKGAEVIRMMHTLLGEQNFQKGMQLYFERHDGQAVTCDDFVAAMQDASKIDLTQFKLWYEQVGTPSLKVVTSFDAELSQYVCTITQQNAKHDPIQSPLHIPFAIELLDKEGQALPLIVNGERISKVINLTEEEQTITFEQINECPVAVLLEDFSAPVIVNYDYQLGELIHIIAHASSDYARWEAAQQAFTLQMREAVSQFEQGQPIRLSYALIETFDKLLRERKGDLALLAELIRVPSFDTLATAFEQVPVEALNESIAEFELAIASGLRSTLKDTFTACVENGELDHEAVSARALKNTCLYYLAKCADEQVHEWLESQRTSDNMTLVLGALKASLSAQLASSSAAMNEFDSHWRHDLLVMDKWFALQATQKGDDAIKHIYDLYSHPCFDKGNPNRVRALVGSFARNNPEQFHRVDGKGYELLGDLLVELNAINPQNASRMITPFMSWKRFDAKRQQLMKSQLQRLAAMSDLSDDLYEKVEKALS